ncbi:maltose/moltooligosaccharide transporter [Elusimicrobium simillimum]|uniref:MFS transporter n=1 Tax=Elusimicrobium simillimum TaxID=3143438 RepID=UPI003C6F7EA3
MEHTQSKKTLTQIAFMCFGFFGIQFGWGLQMANMSAIYSRLGADEAAIPLLWLAAPVTGFLVQPIVGYFSDRTWNRLGRRRPYFLGGAIFASLALLIMPHSHAIWMAAMMLWILDTAVNVSMEPFRAFVADILPQDQRKTGYAMQSVMIGAGAVIASALPFILTKWFGVSSMAAAGHIPMSVKLSFTIGAVVYIAAIIITIVTTPETPPKDIAAFEKHKADTSGITPMFTDIIKGIASMPKTMQQLALVQFFTWLGMFGIWTNFSGGVAKAVYGAFTSGTAQYEAASNWAGVCFSIYNGVAFLFAFALIWLTKKYTAKKIHIGCLVAAGVGMASLGLTKVGVNLTPQYLIFPMVLLGIGWASILSMPYAMLSNAIAAEKMGFYMGVFNFFIVLPQILGAFIYSGILLAIGQQNQIVAVALTGICFIIAALFTLKVKEAEA